MPRRRALQTCTNPGCPALVESGRCDEHRREAEQQRGNFRERGYGRGRDKRFRPGELRRDVVCVLCPVNDRHLATVADHWPLSRRELVERGLDPDDPAHGRGLCKRCHDRETAVNQPGGWNAR
jgi:5-methylcytosine-specific restriction protein A